MPHSPDHINVDELFDDLFSERLSQDTFFSAEELGLTGASTRQIRQASAVAEQDLRKLVEEQELLTTELVNPSILSEEFNPQQQRERALQAPAVQDARQRFQTRIAEQAVAAGFTNDPTSEVAAERNRQIIERFRVQSQQFESSLEQRLAPNLERRNRDIAQRREQTIQAQEESRQNILTGFASAGRTRAAAGRTERGVSTTTLSRLLRL